jgi:hypothetical protein
VHLKLKNNIKKVLISLTLGSVLCTSFLLFPVKQAAAVDTCADTTPDSQVYSDKSAVYLDEDIVLYSESPLPPELVEQCKNKDYIIHNYFFRGSNGDATSKDFGKLPASYREQLPGYVVKKTIKGKDLLFANPKPPGAEFYTITVTVTSYGTADLTSATIAKTATITVKNTNRGDNPLNPTVNNIPDDVNEPGSGDKKTWNPDDLFVTVSGYSILRTVKGDPTNVPYTLKWGGASVDNHPILKDNIQRAQDTAISGTYEGLYGAVNYQGVTNLECGKKLDDFGCETGAIADGQNFGPPPFEDLVDIPWSKFATEYAANPSTSTKTFTKGFILFPVVQIGLSNDTALTKGDFIKFVVEIYATDDDRTKACVAEQTKKNNTDAEAYCQDPKNKAVGGELQESTFTSSDDGTNAGVGGSIADFIAQVIGTIMWFVVGIIYNIFSIVIAPLIEISLAIHTYTDDFAKVILPGWELLRNLSNIFFIVILLAIGLATLFRVQKYQYRNLLLKLILAALLVNFSLVITQSILAIAETVQSQFLPIEKNDDVVRTIAKSIMFAPFEQGTITPEVASKSLSESLSRLIFPFFYLALSIMGFIVMGSLAILLIVRLAAIWILLMTSPIAFVAWVLPATSKYTDKWLDNLFRYGFFVAVIGFFLNVVAFLAQRQGGVFQDLTDSQVTGWDGFLSRIATNLMILIFMIVAMGTASSLKIKGAKFAQKAAAFPLDWLRTNLGARSAKLQSQGGWKGALGKAGLIATNPDAYYKAGIQRWTDTKKKQTDRIEAGAYDLSRGVFRGKKTNRLQELREKEIAELDKTNPYFNGDQALREFNKIKGKGYDSQVAREFWMRKMMENKDFGKLLKDKNLPDNLDGMLGLINQLANSGEIDKEASAYLVDVLTGSAKKNKNEKFVAGNKDKDGKAALIQGNMVGDIFVPATEEDIAAYDKVKEARKKRFNKTSDNDKVQGITPDSPFIELPNGQTTIDVYGAMLVANANDSYLTKAGRDMDPGQTKNFGKLLENGEQIDKSVQKVADILREQDKENGIKHDNSPEDQEEVMGRAKTKFREYSRWAHNIELEEDMRTYRRIYPTQTNAFEKRSFKDDPEYIGEHAKMEDKTQRQLEKAINVAFSKPGTYRDTFTEDIARKIRSTPGFGTPGGVNLPKMEEKVRTQMGQMFADRFVPKDLGLKEIPSTQVASTKREIQNIITNVSSQNRPGTNVTNDAYRALPLSDPLKRQEIFRRVTEHIASEHFRRDPEAATKAQKVANQILGDIK